MFRTRRGGPITRRRYNTLFDWAQAVLPWSARTPVTAHALRHTAGAAIERIAGYSVAEAFLGHAPSSVTGIYSRARLDEVAAAVEALTGEPHPSCTPTGRPPMSVTALDTSSWTPAERQAAARDTYRASGYRLSGAELGHRSGRSGRWGRAQIQAVATEDRATIGRHSCAPIGVRYLPVALLRCCLGTQAELLWTSTRTSPTHAFGTST